LRRVIRWNFLWVFLYNTVGIGLAVAGEIRPVLAAFAMVLSSLLVIVNSSTMARFKQWVRISR
jgi:cation transport ATPase